MGVNAKMFVKTVSYVSDTELVDVCYRLTEAVGGSHFFLANEKDLARGEFRRALGRAEGSYFTPDTDSRWLRVSLAGRYYGPGYERGDPWVYVAVAEWLERNLHGCEVRYGGDAGDRLELFDREAREALIAHWAYAGGRPYFQSSGWASRAPVLAPVCPLCLRPATPQYGSGGDFASWSCDACRRHWVWASGQIKMFDPQHEYFDSFKAAEELRAQAKPTTTST